MKKKILVLCTGNSCRSQMAHGFLKQREDLEVYSAGVETHGVNPRAIASMQEVDIDISHHTSNNLEEYLGIAFDMIFTVCDNANERCPVFPGNARRVHHNFPDPAKATGTEDEIMASFRATRDEVQRFCKALEIP
jgi:arsenate reductase